MSQMVGQTNRRAQEYPEKWPENRPEHWTEKCLEQIRPEGWKGGSGRRSGRKTGWSGGSPDITPSWNTVSQCMKRMVLLRLWKDSESKAAEGIWQGVFR
jgi:hypothetical protein